MRTSRALSLAALTAVVTIGGIGAAAADTVSSASSSTTLAGTTSQDTTVTGHSYTADATTISPAGAASTTVATGIGQDGQAYYTTYSQFANASGVGESTTSNSTGDFATAGDYGFGGHRQHEGLLSGLLSVLL
jgi:hypothetical protein